MYLEVYEDHEWADLVAEMWTSFMQRRPDARICLPTGETPRPLYASSAPNLDLSSTTVFLLDEFDLPRGSAARCDSMFEQDLLRLLVRPPKAQHRLRVEASDADAECSRFDAIIGKGGLDLTILGLGGNGHIGLNEPGTSMDSPTRMVDLSPATTRAAKRYDADANALRGMTLGMHRIIESDEVWLLVTGSHKTAVLERMLSGPIGPELPASYLRDHPNATVFADRSAAPNL